MANHYWIKLYTEILEDPKMGHLPDHLYRRVIEIFCIAGDNHKDGALPSPTAIAWKLRTTEQEILNELQQIYELTNIVHPNGNSWVVTKFAARQAPADPTAAQRMQNWRERKENRNENRNIPYDERNVTRNVTTELRVDTDIDIDTESEQKQKKKQNPPTAAAILSFNDISARDAEQVYTRITGQPSIPNDQIDNALGYLIPIIASYDDPKKIIDDGLGHFTRWCNSRGKSGRHYSRTNTAWLSRWYEALAPDPGPPKQEGIEQIGALCGKGQALKRKAEDMGDRDHEQAVLDYRAHMDTCHICGGKPIESAPMPDAIREKLRQITGKMEVKNVGPS